MVSGHLSATVVACFTRRTDLGDSTTSHKANKEQPGSNGLPFARIRIRKAEGARQVGALGFEGSMEYHRTMRAKSERCRPAARRRRR